MVFKIFKTARTPDPMPYCIVVAFWFDEGLLEEDARYLIDTFSTISTYHLGILQPSWILAVCPDDSVTRRSVLDVLAMVLKKRDQGGFSCDLRIGIQLGKVLMSLDKNSKSLTHPIGSPVSDAMKKASESSYDKPCVGLEEFDRVRLS